MSDYQGRPSVLRALLQEMRNGASLERLHQRTKINSRATLMRYIKSLREDWGCFIEYDRSSNRYRLLSAGLFDWAALD